MGIGQMLLDALALFLTVFVGGCGTAAIIMSLYVDHQDRINRRNDAKLRAASRR